MFKKEVLSVFVLACVMTSITLAGENDNTQPANVAIRGGVATFVVNTNVPAVSVKGKSASLEGHVQVRSAANGLHLEKLEAHIPVKTLATGMGLRDEHMRKYIFTTRDGQTPDLLFSADSVACTGAPADAACPVSGNLSIRGVAKPFTLPLKVRQDGATFKASGEAVLKLSTYGIEQPSQFGVKTADEVHLHFEFSGKPGGDLSSAAAVRQ